MLTDFGTAIQVGLSEDSLKNLKPEDTDKLSQGDIALQERKWTSEMTNSSSPAATLKYNMSLIGTQDYVAPEIIKSEKATFASDLWSLGIIIY